MHRATRAMLLSTEMLKARGQLSEAIPQFSKLALEDSDLRSGLLLEQAALCHLALHSPNVRKYAFNLVIAGHRFSKAGLRTHALRCYNHALQVYRGHGWSIAEVCTLLLHPTLSLQTSIYTRLLGYSTCQHMPPFCTHLSSIPVHPHSFYLHFCIFLCLHRTSRAARIWCSRSSGATVFISVYSAKPSMPFDEHC